MDALSAVAFFAGMLLFVTFTVDIRARWRRIGLALLISFALLLLAIIITYFRDGIAAVRAGFTLPDVIFGLAILSLFFLYVLLKNDLLPQIDERAALLSTLLLWSFILAGALSRLWAYAAILPTILVLVVALYPRPVHRVWGVLLYLWHIVVLLAIAYVHYAGRTDLFSAQPPRLYLDALLFGIFAMYLVTNALTLLLFLPGKYGGVRRVIEHARDVAAKFADDQTMPAYWLFLLCVGAALVLNGSFALLPPLLVADAVLLFAPQLWKRISPAAPQLKL